MQDIQKQIDKVIGKLPRWAQVAFAARCARRVQPLYNTIGQMPRRNI